MHKNVLTRSAEIKFSKELDAGKTTELLRQQVVRENDSRNKKMDVEVHTVALLSFVKS